MFLKYCLISVFLDEIISIFITQGDKYPDFGNILNSFCIYFIVTNTIIITCLKIQSYEQIIILISFGIFQILYKIILKVEK